MNAMLEPSISTRNEARRPPPPVWPSAPALRPAALSGELLALVLDEVDVGLMVLAADAHPLFANRAALRACGPGARFRLENGVVRAARAADANAFARAMHDARLHRRTLLPLSVEPGRADEAADASMRFLAFIPLGGAAGAAPEPRDRMVLLVFGRPQICGALSTQFFALEHGMTMAECSVLTALCDGRSPRQIAEGLGIAISTVRTHVMRIRAKTGASSISDLLRIAAMLPPLVACGCH